MIERAPPELFAYTRAIKEAVVPSAQLIGAPTRMPSRWLVAIAGNMEHVDFAAQQGVAQWPASHRTLTFLAASDLQLGFTAVSPESDTTAAAIERLRESALGTGPLGLRNVEGSEEFASVGELLRAFASTRSIETSAVTMSNVGRLATRRLTAARAVRERFAALAAQWREETGLEPSVSRRAMSWPYQQIIGLGVEALPLILEELERETDDWFWALAAISGEDPAEGAQTLDAAAEAWLEWGRNEGHLGAQAT